eukprot:c14138_g1_i1 orf=45-1841(+)
MGLMVILQMRSIPLFCVCAALLSFPIPAFTNPAPFDDNVALPRMLLVASARPSCETNCTSHLDEEEHGLPIGPIIKAISPSPTSSCKQTYGVMPCTHSIIGGLFLLSTYGYIIFRAARLLVEGSELLLLLLNPGVIGGLVLPLFGVLPDSILILVSGIGGSKAEAQDDILIGIGLLAGSNVMLLTLLWGICLTLGRCDLKKDLTSKRLFAIEKTRRNRYDFFETGVQVDKETRAYAGFMCASIIPLLVVQLPHVFNSSKANNIALLIACLLSFGGLLTYSIYQVMYKKLEDSRRRIRSLHDVILFNVWKYSHEEENLVSEDGKINEELLKRMFDSLDLDPKDGKITRDEVRVMLAVNCVNKKLHEQVLEQFMKDFDANRSDDITWDEFLSEVTRWCKDVRKTTNLFSFKNQEYIKIQEHLDEAQEILLHEMKRGDLSRNRTLMKAIFYLLVGTLLISLFSQPLVDAITNFSVATHIPSFFVSFVLLPLASNSSESISSVIFAKHKQVLHSSLTYSEIYGGVTMNNTMSLGIFLAIIYARGLMWEFSSEVLIICLVTLVMGVMAVFREIYPFWTIFIALPMYPFSIALVAILDYIVGWK